MQPPCCPRRFRLRPSRWPKRRPQRQRVDQPRGVRRAQGQVRARRRVALHPRSTRAPPAGQPLAATRADVTAKTTMNQRPRTTVQKTTPVVRMKEQKTMTKPTTPDTAPKKRRSGGPSAATRITTAGLAVAITLGLGGAVAARAAEQKRADAKLDNPDAATTDDATQSAIAAEVAAATAKVKAEDQARFDKQIKALTKKYQKAVDSAAAGYAAKLSASSSSSSSGSSGSSGGSSSSSGGGSYSSSKGSSSSGSSSSKGSSSSSSSGSSGSSASAPKAPSKSKGS